MAREIKKAFQEWDADGNGTISWSELARIMRRLTPLLDEDIDSMMRQVDKNRNGQIEYTEFVDWLMKPAVDSHARAMLNYSEVVRPLFEVYDTSGDGKISQAEFEECHCILQGALKLNPSKEDEDDDEKVHPLDLEMCAREAFKEADESSDGCISFLDFVQWMREHIESADLTNDELVALFVDIADVLRSTYKLIKTAEAAPQDFDPAPLQDLVGQLAEATREFSDALNGDEAELSNTWTEPPKCLSVDRLKGAHMKMKPLNMRSVSKVDVEVLCIPTAPKDGKNAAAAERIWLGEVVRTVDYKSGKRVVEPPGYYGFETSTYRWIPLESEQFDGRAAFDKHLNEMPKEIALFCLLKTEANFGTELTWKQVNFALKCAVMFGFLKADEVSTYTRYMEDLALKAVCGNDTPLTVETAKDRPQDKVLEKLCQIPRVVMATLTKLGIIRGSSVWKDFMGASPISSTK